MDKKSQNEKNFKERVNILIVDDLPINVRLINLFLELLGYKNVDSVASAEEAYEAIRAAEYDIILMDLAMPNIDGLEASKTMRERVPERTTIVGCTAHYSDFQHLPWDEAGIQAIIQKPLDLKEFEQRMESWAKQAVKEQ